MRTNLVLFACLAGLAVTGTSTADERIRCPAERVRTEVTTRLSEPWWQTPQVGSLRGAEVTTVGGEPALVCRYWAYGTEVAVMRRPPSGAGECRAVRGGFECRGGAAGSAPTTHSTGGLSIPQTYTVELDEGGVVAGAEADLWFQAETPTRRYLTPRNGARIGVVGRRSVGRDGCDSVRLSERRVSLRDMPEGTYVCARTNRGRYAQFRVNAEAGPSPGELRIGYTTWE